MTNKFEQLIFALLVALSLTWTSGAFALPIDVTQPGDSILLVNGVNDGGFNAGPPPAAESVEHARGRRSPQAPWLSRPIETQPEPTPSISVTSIKRFYLRTQFLTSAIV